MRRVLITMIRLSRLGPNVTTKDFQGDTISQNGQYLHILNVNEKIVASLILEPGYCLASSGVMSEELDSAVSEFGRTLRARAERNGTLVT